jgi:hypothetical protein
VKDIGKPCAGKPLARIDEGRLSLCRLCLGLGFKFPTVHIDHIFIYQLPIRELMIQNVIDPNKIKMTSAGMVATAHLTIRTTIE